MQKNLDFYEVVRRRNPIKEAIFNFALSVFSVPRLLLEVFIRRRFGVRYFSYFTVCICTFFLLWMPTLIWETMSMIGNAIAGKERSGWVTFLQYFLTWYVFVGAFFYVSTKRRQEIKRSPSVFDFELFSLFNGYLTRPCWELMRKWLPNCSIRKRETIIEPLAFFIIGFVLIIFGQPIGLVILLSSIFYSLSYFGAYHKGDDWVMDWIDKIILNEEKEKVFLEDEDPEFGRGVRFFAERPTSKEMREKITKKIVLEEDEPVISR